MQAFTPADASAILGKSRTVQYFATFSGLSGGALLVKSFTTDRQLKDQPQQVNLFGGVAAGQCTLEIDSSSIPHLSPFMTQSPSGKLKTTVVVQVQVGSGTVYTIFTGVVTDVSFDNDSATITCLDPSSQMSSKFDLKPGGIIQLANSIAPQDLDILYSPLTVIDQALRSGDMYLSPLPWITDKTDRDRFCLLSVSGFGGYLPDIGYLGSTLVHAAQRVPGKFAPEIIAQDFVSFEYNRDIANIVDHNLYQFEGWFRVVDVAPTSNVLLMLSPYSITMAPDGTMSIMTPGSNQATDGFTTFTVGKAVRAGWNYLRLTQSVNLGRVSFTMQVNRFIQVLEIGIRDFLATSMFAPNNVTPVMLGADTFPIAWEAVEIHYVPSTVKDFVAPPYRFGKTGNTTANITLTDARLKVIDLAKDLPAWDTIQQIAQADGSLAYFDEFGVFTYEPRSVFQARKMGAPVASYTWLDRLQSLPMQVSDESLFGSVSSIFNPRSVNYGVWGYSDGIAAWKATEQYDFPARTTTKVRVQTDVRFVVPLLTADFSVNTAPQNSLSCVYGAVETKRVGDPAAPVIGNLRLTVYPEIDGFTLAVSNPNPFSVSFWTNTGFPAWTTTTGVPVAAVPPGPYLWIDGYKLTTGTPQTFTRTANPNSKDALTLEENTWRQDPDLLIALMAGVAADVAAPIPALGPVQVPGDPRIQLGDVVSVMSNKVMTTAIPCLVVGIGHNGNPEDAYTMSLSLRPLGQPFGWLLGIPGRSELGTTAQFINY